jgi:hypothetical protein
MYYIYGMKKLSIIRLKELGFKRVNFFRFTNGNVFVEFYPLDSLMDVYISARITAGEDYARPAVGVKNEKDLVELCRLVNG